MPKVIVNSCYIKDSQHFINYLEYAGQKLEAQTLVLNNGTKIDLDPDELLDVTETPDFRYVQLEMKDGTIKRLGFEKYQKYVEEKTETIAEVSADKDFPEKDLQHTRSSKKYLDYIAFRPSVEKNPNLSHGLFGINGAADIQHAKQSVLENENSYKWSHIISLTREDAEASGFDNRAAWENLIRSRAYDIGKLYNIPSEHLEIYAAYHDKAHHPHCHLFFWSNTNSAKEGCAGFNEGDLTKKSEKLRSLFTNEIFINETAYLKKEQQLFRKELSEELKKYVQEIGKANYQPDKEIVNAFFELSNSLSDYTGRAYYAYISPEQKEMVNNFLKTAISKDENLNHIYNKLLKNQLAFISLYNDEENKINSRLNDFENHFFKPNSKNGMRQLHNIIIEASMLFNQQINSPPKIPGVVRKEKTISILQDNYEISNNSKNNNAHYKNYQQEDSENNRNTKSTKNSHNNTQKTKHRNQKVSYASSLLLYSLAHAMANLAMQYAYNKQHEEEEKKQKNKKNHPKFASKNHQISKAHLKPQSPIQY